MPYVAPKTVAKHPGVEGCFCGDAEGSDYRHYVELKDGWVFENGRGAGCSALFYNQVWEFKHANPILAGSHKVRAAR